MKEMTLAEAMKQTTYQIAGHGKRNLQVLKNAIHELEGDLGSDQYGQGQIIEDFQKKMASLLGKEEAVFFPSGTMAQQIALRIWCDQKGVPQVAYHPLCHLEIHEEDGLKELHHIKPILLAGKDKLIQLEDVVGMKEEIACLLLELPQREIGGQLPDYETIESIASFCNEKGIKLHLDGARLFEILPYYNKSAAEICTLFDSVYISFYKGIGGIAGAILAGDKAFIQKSKVWKRRHGGDLISLYPYILSSDYYFDLRINKMDQYYREAQELAEYFNQCSNVSTRPATPVSNMFHVHIAYPKEVVEPILIELYQQSGVGLAGNLREIDDHHCYFEVSVGDAYGKIPKETLDDLFRTLDVHMSRLSK